MRLQFQTVDVFTADQFSGNPLAVVLNAEALSGEQMSVMREAAQSNPSFRGARSSREPGIHNPTFSVQTSAQGLWIPGLRQVGASRNDDRPSVIAARKSLREWEFQGTSLSIRREGGGTPKGAPW
jgi:hypothetical protein